MCTNQEGADLENGRKLFARPVEFVKSVVALDGLPVSEMPEICFAGRSNVGKSSLINAVCNQKGLARASNTPGRTRELNYFNISDRLYLVDLPGYGYAKASKTEIAKWTRLTLAYLKGRAGLRRVFVLIDSRRGIMAADLEIMAMLDEAAVIYQIVLTKADKLKQSGLEKTIAAAHSVIAKRPAAHPEIILTSAEKKTGLETLRAEIAGLALPQNGL